MSSITCRLLTPNCDPIASTETSSWRSRYVIMPSRRRSLSLARSAIGGHLLVERRRRAQQVQHRAPQAGGGEHDDRVAVADELLGELPLGAERHVDDVAARDGLLGLVGRRRYRPRPC